MDRQHVNSSNLHSVGYDEEESVLEIEFWADPVYCYYGVFGRTYRALVFAGSKGKYFDSHIRKRNYRYRQVG